MKCLAAEQIDDAQAGLFPGVAGGLAANEKVLIAHAGRKMLTAIDSNTNQILWSAFLASIFSTPATHLLHLYLAEFCIYFLIKFQSCA